MMRKVLIFISGVITGAILMFAIAALVGNSSNSSGMVFFEKEGSCVSDKSFEVFQVLDSGDALAHILFSDIADVVFEEETTSVGVNDTLEEGMTSSASDDLIVLFLCEDGKSYYDNQVIKIPSGKCAKQIGIFKYSTKVGVEKTVPIVSILDK